MREGEDREEEQRKVTIENNQRSEATSNVFCPLPGLRMIVAPGDCCCEKKHNCCEKDHNRV